MPTGTTLMAIRLVYESTRHAAWESLPIVAYMPMFLAGDGARENIEKRVQLTYFRHDPTIIRAYCHPKDTLTAGFWVEPVV